MSNDDSSSTSLEVSGIFESGNQKNGALLQPKYRGKARPSDPFVPREMLHPWLSRISWFARTLMSEKKHWKNSYYQALSLSLLKLPLWLLQDYW